MGIKIKDLIDKLRDKDQKTEVEFVVVDMKGNVICMDIKTNAKSLRDILKLFGDK